MKFKEVLLKNFNLKIDKAYSGEDRNTAKILHTLYAILPLAYIIIIVASLLNYDYPVVGLIGVIIIITIISRRLLLLGKLRQSVQFFIISIIFTLTTICTFGQGIHDITLTTFPPLIVFTGQLLNKKEQLVTSGLIILSIIWLALGEKYGLYQPIPPPGIITELIVIITILIISTLITHQMAKNFRSTLTKTHIEIEKRKTRREDLEHILETKSRLTNTVHGRIAESLSIIREILIHQGGTKDTRLFTHRLSTQIEAISIIHKRLHENESEKYIELNDYLRSLVVAYIDQPSWQEVSIKCKQNIQLDIEQAMSLGLYLLEIISHSMSESGIEVVVELHDSLLNIQVHFDQADSIKKTTLSDIMVQQMNGSVNQNEDSGVVELEFSLQKKDK